MAQLTLAYLKSILHYDPETGIMTRIAKTSNRVKVGSPVTTKNNHGYNTMCILSQRHQVHRLAWFYMTGKHPECEIDHRNRVRHDNRWCNLREASRSEQSQNLSRRSDNTSGIHGVHWNKARNKWQVYIELDGKRKRFASCGDFFEACCVRKSAENKLGWFSLIE